jgi:endoglycosylceramidase
MNEPFPGQSGGKLFRKLIASLVKVSLTDKRIKLTKLLRDAIKNPNHVLDQYTGDVLSKIAAACASTEHQFDEEHYTPFLNKITAAIREVDPEHTVIFDQCYWNNFFIPCAAGPISSNGKPVKNQCFTPHAYDLTVDTPAYEFANNNRTAGMFAEARRTQERLVLPVVVGEWGGGGEGTNWYPHISFLLDLFEKYKWSNTYFFYLEDAEEMAYRNKKDVGKQDLFDIPLANTVLNRPFPMAVSGEIKHYHYDESARSFALSFNQIQVSHVPTEVFLPSKPLDIQVDNGEYALEEYGDAYYIKWKTAPGTHTFKVQL